MPPLRAAAALALLCAALSACASPTSTAGPASTAAATPSADPRELLRRFAEAARAGRWEEAWPLLSERWRAATSPGRLAADWRGAGPVAQEAADRVLALLDAGARLEGAGDARRLPVGTGHSARLVLEAGRWRVDALE